MKCLRFVIAVSVIACGRTGPTYVDDMRAVPEDNIPPSEFNPPFPRLAGIFTAAPQAYDTLSFREQAARYHVVVMTQWDGWQRGRDLTMAEVIRDLKARASHGLYAFTYVHTNGFSDPMPSTSAEYELWQKLEAENWWLYRSGASGTRVKGPEDEEQTSINITDAVPPDAAGQRWHEWYAQWLVDHFVLGSERNAENPYVDGFYLAGIKTAPNVDGDWNLDGALEDGDDIAGHGAYRRAYAHLVDELTRRWPGTSLHIGATAEMLDDVSYPYAKADYDQILGGGFGDFLGQSYSIETWGGFEMMMVAYHRNVQMAQLPKAVIFGHANLVPTDYQGFRYGLGAVLMGDGYYFPHDQSYPDGTWFDELDVDLGYAREPAQTAAWSQGVWRREFDNGVVLVNPKGNGERTVSVGPGLRKLNGAQAPSINDGTSVTTVTLKDRDGIVLVRQ